jgi:hypothetical protein
MKDQKFANRLYADLQNKGVRCWFAPHDMPIGGKIRDEIDAAIKLRDKVLLVLSEHSIKSKWVEDEVDGAFEEEQKRDHVVLFPIRLDNDVLTTGAGVLNGSMVDGAGPLMPTCFQAGDAGEINIAENGLK